ncbi:hypothetical protein [Endozoicomonas elysicola]|uniref:Fungal lipase-like domain-containing protein n=1 Tax=Endozoicomonas elysicola TaxID=305900 RepID=A0A081KBQ0_9GAMM|nr:hypothetical protein [Endozoicomonas elysicola]KEI71576.1 hypothetical protein GV64_13250 [Endozoicomonas elysicola]
MMKLNKTGSPENSPNVTRTSEHELEGHHKGRNVKLSRGQKIIQWFSSLKKSLIAGIALLRRSIKLSFSKDPAPMKGRYWEQVPLPNDPRQLKEIAIDSALAQIPYTLNNDPVSCWKTVREAENILIDSTESEAPVETQHQIESRFFEEIINNKKEKHISEFKNTVLTREQQDMAQNELFHNFTLLPSGMIVDHKTGLTAVMVINQATDKITLIFGGTNSAYGASELLDDSGLKIGKKPGRLRAQLKANWQNLTGQNIPDCYHQAAKLVQLIKSMANSNTLLKRMGLDDSLGMLFLTGHSLGGGLVQYSAPKNKVLGRTFSPAALGYKVLEDLTIEEKELARNGLVSNYLIDNDLITTPSGYGLWHKWLAPTVIGKRTIIHGNKTTGKNTLYGRHSWSHLHYMVALEHKKKAKK